MYKRVKKSKLGVKASHRDSLRRNLLRSLFEKNSVVTTTPKAKVLKMDASSLIEKGKKMASAVKQLAFDGKFFVDNLVRNQNGMLIKTNHYSEVCQYYAFWFDIADKHDYSELYEELMERLALRSLRPIGVTDIPAAEKLIKQAQEDGDPFKLILVDMHLTGLGKDANPLTELAKSGVCMVALLPFGELFKADELKANGFTAVLTKPFRRKDFWKILQAAVSEKAPETGSATPKTIANLQSVLKDTNDKTSTNPIVKNAEILLVEDNLINQKIVLAILKKMGIQADIAVNGKIALDMLSQKTYRLVLMDIQMPVMDGFEATEKIRDPNTPVKDHQIPIIAMTAHAIDGYRDSCIKAGMNDYIAKPVTPQQMREKLELWLRKDLET